MKKFTTVADREVRTSPFRPVLRIALAASMLASLLALVSMMWQHTASVAAAIIAQDLGYGTVKGGAGAKALALGWSGFAMVTLTSIGLLVLMLSDNLLDELVVWSSYLRAFQLA